MNRFPFAAAVLAIGVLLGGAAPAAAQNYYEDDIVVYGAPRLSDDINSVSQRVSYADLHLQYSEDRRELRRRVTLTAGYVCDALGEDDRGYGGVTGSCRDNALRDAMRQVRIIEARYAPPRYAYSDHAWLEPRDWARR